MNRLESMRRDLSRQQVATLLAYCPETGLLTWLQDRRGKTRAGATAGAINLDGYVVVRVLNQQHRAHRLAWLLMTGEWPAMHIDHINGRRDDNRFCNLRQADYTTNAHNLKLDRRGSRSGLLGATWNSTRREWKSSIQRNGVRLDLGSFTTAELAHSAYLKAKQSGAADRTQ